MRYFTDSDRVDTVRFFEVPDDRAAFPGTSLVYPAWNDAEKWPAPPEARGTIRPEYVRFTGMVEPAGLFSGHFCGSLEQHERGQKYDPDPRPVGALGWPLCCHPPFRVRGGGGGGPAGGYTLSGGITPSADCHVAPALTQDVPFVVNVPATGGPYYIRTDGGLAPSVWSMRITSYLNGGTWTCYAAFPDACTGTVGGSTLTGVGCVNNVFTGLGNIGAVQITPSGVAGRVVVVLSNFAC